MSQSRAVALDMESATIAANGYRFRVPYGTLIVRLRQAAATARSTSQAWQRILPPARRPASRDRPEGAERLKPGIRSACIAQAAQLCRGRVSVVRQCEPAKGQNAAPDFQPDARQSSITIRPIVAGDWQDLFAAGSDPKIWEVHTGGPTATPSRASRRSSMQR